METISLKSLMFLFQALSNVKKQVPRKMQQMFLAATENIEQWNNKS